MPNSLYSDLCDVYDEGKKPYLFISYSHEDTTSVVAAIRALQRVGYRIWYDMGISAGAQWPEDVADHIYGCDAVLAFMTPNAIISDNCREELFYAKKLKKNILLAYLQECDLSHGMDMRLGTLQFIDRRRCKDDEEFYTRLAKAKILQPCRGEIEGGNSEASASIPAPAPTALKPKTKIEELREKAEKGDAQAQFDLGWAYDQGNGIPQDQSEAAKWYRKAADQGHRIAQYNLGCLYHSGSGVCLDHAEAAKWYHKAVAQGYTYATNNLGTLYQYGTGVEQDLTKAMGYYRQSAEAGNSIGQYNLGLCYEYSMGVAQDWDEAARWYRKAADQGYAHAQKQMVTCYRKGLGVPVDEAEAAHWQKLYDENPNK